MSAGWYYVEDDRPVGPINSRDLRRVLSQNVMWRDVLVWKIGHADWEKAGSVTEVLQLLQQPPPIPTTEGANSSAFQETLASSAETTKQVRPSSAPGNEPKNAASKIIYRARWGIGKLVTIVVTLILASLAGLIGRDAARTILKPSAREIQEGLLPMAEKLNEGLPRLVDQSTRLDKVTVDGKIISYKHTLVAMSSAAQAARNGALQQHARSALIKRVCASKVRDGLLKHGVSVAFVYHASDGSWIDEVRVTDRDCTNNGSRAVESVSTHQGLDKGVKSMPGQLPDDIFRRFESVPLPDYLKK